MKMLKKLTMIKNNYAVGVLIGLTLALNACHPVGPDYVKPTATSNPLFKEADGWKIAEPQDHQLPAQWWSVFQDETLNSLEAQVAVSNQNIQAYEARYRQAVALTKSYRAAYYPSVTGTASHTRNQPSANSTNSINGPAIRTTNNLSFTINWEADVWGHISRTVEAGQATVAATQQDLMAATLSAQAELAQSYFVVRTLDNQLKLLEEATTLYEKSLQVTRHRYEAGVVGKSDVLQAETLLKTTQLQREDIRVQRAQSEHAIAVLIGKAPSEYSLAVSQTDIVLPQFPISVPSTVLERRPDIAASERRVAAANAQIGVAKAAFYPTISLSAVAGVQSNQLSNLFSWPSRIWSLGSSLAMTVFDAGKRSALSEQAVASYDETVANYRQTVLTAFQEVEDSLAALNVLQNEANIQSEALKTAQASQVYVMNQYKAGVVTYLDVVTRSNTALSHRRNLETIKGNQLTQSILLIKALGGGA